MLNVKTPVIFVVLCCLSINALSQVVNFERKTYHFNSDWKWKLGDDTLAKAVTYNDAGWSAITLPHAFNEGEAFKKPIQDLTTGIVWYRKHFKIDPANKGKKVFIEFEGIRHGGEFFLNGKSIGISENGVMAFGFDLSELIIYGAENVISARIDNSWNYHEKSTNSGFQWSDKNFYANYGGINKNVYLHIANKLYQTLPLYSNLKTTGVYVYAKDFDIGAKSALITAETEIKNEYQTSKTVEFEVEIVDDVTGKRMANFKGGTKQLGAFETMKMTASARINNLHFWSWGYGYLYRVNTILKINGQVEDRVSTKTGFRKTAFSDGMVYLNNRAIHLKGYAQRTTNEWPAIGLSVPAWLSDYSNQLMVTSNANLVRWMHVTPWKQDVESCDRVGLLQVMPAGDSEKDVEGRRWEQRKELMRDAIIYNRNSPSILFYECGNKGISQSHMMEMLEIRDRFDQHGGRAMGAREMLNSKLAEFGGEMLYINKSANKPVWQMEYSRDEGLRKYWDEYSPPFHKEGAGPLYKGADASIYNHNQDAHAIENVVRWFDYWQERPGTGKRVNGGGVNIIFSESNTHYRGEENYRRSGEVDALRIPKDGFFAHQVIWDGWVDIENPRIHILGHWNYSNDVVKDMIVVSGADKVELFINGVSRGYGTKSNRFLFRFPAIQWQPGIVSAVGYDNKGNAVCGTKHETAGSPFALRLKQINSPVDFLANGADMALLEVEVVDAKGNRCPTALNEINFDLKGAAQWIGGMAQGPDNYILSKLLPVECGVNRVLIRSTTTAGNINLIASANGLQIASLKIVSKPFLVKDGLALQLPKDGLTGNLERGPTPSTPSFKPTRIPLTIINTTAGANLDKATFSFDDNEVTDWVNDDKLATAWIEYELAQTTAISEITMKLNNFRTRSYPIRITVDGNEVYNGTPAKNLGYTTIVLKQNAGKKIKIQLLAATISKDDETTEVNGKKLDDGIARDDSQAKGRLSIIEVELYKKIQ